MVEIGGGRAGGAVASCRKLSENSKNDAEGRGYLGLS